MSAARPPTWSSEPPPPPSRTRTRTGPDAFAQLSSEGAATVLLFARGMLDDELRRTPHLVNASLHVFAARVQSVTNEASEDMLIGELFEELDARGEATGLGLEAFKARLRTAHRASLLGLRAWTAEDGTSGLTATASAVEDGGAMLHLVRRTTVPLPIPWGRPAPLVPRTPRVIRDLASVPPGGGGEEPCCSGASRGP
jgi:hypothetical protein